MSYLMGDDYASSSSSESEREGEASGAIHERNTRLRDEEEEQEDEEQGVTQRLPPADSVLSAVSASTASYLPPTRCAKLQRAVQSFDLTAETRTERHQQEPKEPQPQRGREEAQCMAGSGNNARKRPRPTEEPAASQPLATRERKDAKERVKSQRVKGQAGIGADFRSWKSETEMALRQQFD